MRAALYLAWRHIAFYRGRSAILVVALAITVFLPLAVQRLIDHYGAALVERAQATPLVVGAKGNRYDLVLKSLYFDTPYDEQISRADVATIKARDYGAAIPLHVRYTAHKYVDTSASAAWLESAAVVGTDFGYFDFRRLTMAAGTLPLLLGDAVAGAGTADRLGLGPGDSVLTDPVGAYDPARSFQLKMPIVGVLAETGTPDDDAIFVDVKTAWVIDGIGHGHTDVSTTETRAPIDVARSTDKNTVTTPAYVAYQEITDANRGSFHFHGPAETFPLTAVILRPRDAKAETIARGWYNLHQTRDLLVPSEVIDELLGLVFRIKRFFDANVAMVSIAMALLVSLVVMLSYRLRKPELDTMFRLGCARATAFRLLATELAILVVASLALAYLGAVAVTALAPALIGGGVI